MERQRKPLFALNNTSPPVHQLMLKFKEFYVKRTQRQKCCVGFSGHKENSRSPSDPEMEPRRGCSGDVVCGRSSLSDLPFPPTIFSLRRWNHYSMKPQHTRFKWTDDHQLVIKIWTVGRTEAGKHPRQKRRRLEGGNQKCCSCNDIKTQTGRET